MSNVADYHARGCPIVPTEQPSSNAEQEVLICSPSDNAHPTSSTLPQTDGSGMTRVPCKARGVENDHNASNAYISVPADPSHGLILLCSHAECVNSGRKFRYCAVCHTPVAIRNFMIRHSHGFNRLGLAKDNVASANCVSSARPVRQEKSTSRCVSPDSNEMTALAKKAGQELRKDLDEASEDHPKKSMKLALTAEEKEWLSRLDSRPESQDAGARTNWLESVVSCSKPHESDWSPCDSEFGSLISGHEDMLSVCDDDDDLDDTAQDFLLDLDPI